MILRFTKSIIKLQEGKGEHFPEKFKDIIGKTLKITLSLNTNNLIHGNTVYFASDVLEGVETTPNKNTISSSEINPMVSVKILIEIIG